MEERWPAPSSKGHAHSQQSFQDEANDFFSTLPSTASIPTRDGEAIATLHGPGDLTAMKPSSTIRSDVHETHVSAGNTPSPAPDGFSSVDTTQIRNHSTLRQLPAQPGLAHVFVGSSFADERSLSQRAQYAPLSEPVLDSEQPSNSNPTSEQLLKSSLHDFGKENDALPLHNDTADDVVVFTEDEGSKLDDIELLELKEDQKSAISQYDADYISANQDSEEAEEEQLGEQSFSSTTQEDAQDDITEVASQLEQVHIDLPPDEFGFENNDYAHEIATQSSDFNNGNEDFDIERAEGQTSNMVAMNVSTEDLSISEQFSDTLSTELINEDLRSLNNLVKARSQAGDAKDPNTRVSGTNENNAASQSDQDTNWVKETDRPLNFTEHNTTSLDDWSAQPDPSANLEGAVDWTEELSGAEHPSDIQAVTHTYEHAAKRDYAEIPGNEGQDVDVSTDVQQELNTTKGSNDNVVPSVSTLYQSTGIPRNQGQGSDFPLARHDDPSENSMNFSFYGSDEVEASQETTDLFASTDDPFLPMEQTKPEHLIENSSDKAELNIGQETTWTTNNEVNEELGDSWAQALGPPDQGLDESWGAAFGDGLDDDGFLEDSPTESFIAQNKTTTPQQVAPTPLLPQSPTTQYAPSAYTASPPGPAQKTIPQPQTSAPMEFFADLPTTQPVRSRKPKPQLVAYPSQIPAPAPPTRPIPPPRTSSVPVPSSQYMPFQPPERLDLFPRQEVSRPTMPTPPSTLPLSYATSQVTPASLPNTYIPTTSKPPANPRYSPVIMQSASMPAPSHKPPSPVPSLYSAIHTQLAPPSGTTGATTRPRSKSPYAPAPVAEPSQFVSSAKQMPGIGSVPQSLPELDEARLPAVPTTNSRYSPANAIPQTAAAMQHKQATANVGPRDHSRNMPPFTNQPPVPNPFAPRTSSPLAQPDQRPHYDRSYTTPVVRPEHPSDSRHIRHQSLGDIMEDTVPSSQSSKPDPDTVSSFQEQANGYSPPRRVPPPRVAAPKLIERAMSYAPNTPTGYQSGISTSTVPPRPRTSSPAVLRTEAMNSFSSSGSTPFVHLPQHNQISLGQQQSQQLSAQDSLDYVIPTDQSAIDPLQRWKGCPIFQWGCGGIVSTSFPTHVPLYGGGQAAPKIKCVGGEVKIRKLKDLYPDQETLLSFPGPLKSKNKKKDVISWLSARIASLEQGINFSKSMHAEDTNSSIRSNEKVLLWQMIRLMVENDGILSGNMVVDLAVKKAILPEVDMISSLRRSSEVVPATNPPTGGPFESTLAAVNAIRQHLLQSEREKAIWHAVDNKLWGHAMLISSTVDKSIWKQVIQEFVRKEVRGSNMGETQSLAALYEIFAGNWDDSVDQLVPLSARTGFHMVSTTQISQTPNSMQNINKWRETLGLVLANRSSGDEQALLALGKLLLGYGRVEAAHTCFIFARSTARFSGIDDSQTTFSLLGADHSADGGDAGRDIDAILLSEIYEFALSLSAPSSSSYYIPHLQVYKLNHAYALCEIGSRGEAMQYCQEIGAALKSTTRGSPYYHATFAAQLDDLAKRLSQTPKDSGSGWISKPSIQQVSGSMGKWFNNFIVGDEADNASTGSGAQSDSEPGPFAKMTGGTPTISRQSSMIDLHSFGMSAADTGGSRYAPNPYPSFAAPDNTRIGQSSYSTSVYGSSPEQIPKSQDRRVNSGNATGAFGSPPSVPPFTRQSSNLSRYRSNEAPIGGISNLIRPQLSAPYEAHAPTVPVAASTNYPPNRPYSTGSVSEPQRVNSYAPVGARDSEVVSRPDSGNEIFRANGVISRPQSQNRQQTFSRLTAVDESPDLGYRSLHSEGHAPSLDTQSQGYTYGIPSSGYAPAPSGYEPFLNNDISQSVEEEPPLNAGRSASSYYGFQGGADEPPNTAYGVSQSGYEPPDDRSDAPNEEFKLQVAENEASQVGYNPMAGYNPTVSGYEPPTAGYEPLPYTPYEPQSPTIEESGPAAKKKSFMDDDDDDEPTKRASELQKQQKAQRDKEAEDNFRRAAEADAARDAKPEKKSGWFGGLFGGGKKDPNAPIVHKAKLGEENSFVFDTETNKWVNRKAGAASNAAGSSAGASSMPPPPKAPPPPSRAASGFPGGPSLPLTASAPGGQPQQIMPPSAPATPDLHMASTVDSRTGSPAMPPPAPASVSGGGGLSTAPPSRPGTGLGNVSDIDDLLGAGVRKGAGGVGGTTGPKKGKRGARYVDVMAK